MQAEKKIVKSSEHDESLKKKTPVRCLSTAPPLKKIKREGVLNSFSFYTGAFFFLRGVTKQMRVGLSRLSLFALLPCRTRE